MHPNCIRGYTFLGISWLLHTVQASDIPWQAFHYKISPMSPFSTSQPLIPQSTLSLFLSIQFKMSYSMIVFMWRKLGLTPDEFRQYYEYKHMPLFRSLVGPNYPQSHTRFYLPRQHDGTKSADMSNASYTPTVFLGSAADFDYDAFASIVFADEKAFDAFHARMRDPAVEKICGEDEENFLWREKTIVAQAGAPYVSLQSDVPTPSA